MYISKENQTVLNILTNKSQNDGPLYGLLRALCPTVDSNKLQSAPLFLLQKNTDLRLRSEQLSTYLYSKHMTRTHLNAKKWCSAPTTHPFPSSQG